MPYDAKVREQRGDNRRGNTEIGVAGVVKVREPRGDLFIHNKQGHA
jgi:hypothetical protein